MMTYKVKGIRVNKQEFESSMQTKRAPRDRALKWKFIESIYSKTYRVDLRVYKNKIRALVINIKLNKQIASKVFSLGSRDYTFIVRKMDNYMRARERKIAQIRANRQKTITVKPIITKALYTRYLNIIAKKSKILRVNKISEGSTGRKIRAEINEICDRIKAKYGVQLC